MRLEDVTAYTSNCFHGEPASCSCACPFHLDIRSFLDKAGRGKWQSAYKELRNAVVFPVIVSMLCPQPCRDRCQRTLVGDEPIALRDIEASVIRFAKNRKPETYFIPPKTQSVAVVGAGVSGLSCALNLAQKKYNVTVFEKDTGWGGSLRAHPCFARFDEDLNLQFSAVNVNFRFETEVKSLAELEQYDAIYVATGANGESFGLKDGWNPELLSTENPKVFLGGELCGASKMEGIAQGKALSKTIEVFLQTGKAAATNEDLNKASCGRYLTHEGAVSAPLVLPASGDGYNEEEAQREASRCLQCDCSKCLDSCEMLKSFRKFPHKLAIEVFSDAQPSQTTASRTVTRETCSCNICGHCKSVCPTDVDLGALFQFSRATRQNLGIAPSALHEYWLREMDFSVTEASFAAAPEGEKSCRYLFFPGCQLGAYTPEHVLLSYAFLREHYHAGVYLGCCGAPAYWAGDEKRMQDNLEAIRKVWTDMGKPVFIFACATCESLFFKFLPEIERVSLYELLAQSEKIAPAKTFPEAAVFDPCAARENPAMEESVRSIAKKSGIALTELKERNRCCGHGGHIRVANPSLYDEITRHRAEASEKPYIVYCANCREVFRSREKDCAHILDLVFGLDEKRSLPTLQEKRENSLSVKRALMKELTGAEFKPRTHDWDNLVLSISPELQKMLDRDFISSAELREAVWQAEESGSRFLDESSGTSLCSLVKPIMTYWVQYKQTEEKTYEIRSAYAHRMRLSEE